MRYSGGPNVLRASRAVKLRSCEHPTRRRATSSAAEVGSLGEAGNASVGIAGDWVYHQILLFSQVMAGKCGLSQKKTVVLMHSVPGERTRTGREALKRKGRWICPVEGGKMGRDERLRLSDLPSVGASCYRKEGVWEKLENSARYRHEWGSVTGREQRRGLPTAPALEPLHGWGSAAPQGRDRQHLD